MKSATFQILTALFLVFVAFESFKLYFTEHQKTERLTANLIISQQQAEYFKARDGQNAVKLQTAEYTIKELRAVVPEAVKAAKSLYIPPRLIQHYTSATTESSTSIEAPVKDSIIYTAVHDTIRAGVIDYRAPFYTIKGTILRDTANLQIQSRDTIKIFDVQGRRRRPWAWILSKRLPGQTIIKNSNPDCIITLGASIKIKR